MNGTQVIKKETTDRAKIYYVMSKYWPLLVFLFVAVIGLFYVKWNPYYQKALVAASKHFIGTSIISGVAQVPPGPSWVVALDYTAVYFKSVWKAMILGLVMASLVEAILPRVWLQQLFGSSRYRSTALAGVAAIPSMMCTCCAAPIALSMRRQSVSAGASLAYWLGNPLLNPATLVFMGFVLSWKWVALRLVAGLVVVFGLAYVAGRLTGEASITNSVMKDRKPEPANGGLFVRWLRAFSRLALESLPIYLALVIILGAFRAWIFPLVNPQWADSLWVTACFAVAGALFIIPTAAEIPIVQTMMYFGLGAGPAAALLVTLPAVSLPSLLIVKSVFPTRVLVLVTAGVIVSGILSGLAATLLF